MIVGDALNHPGPACVLCNKNVSPGDAQLTLACRHVFHGSCFGATFGGNTDWCPACHVQRAPVEPSAQDFPGTRECETWVRELIGRAPQEAAWPTLVKMGVTYVHAQRQRTKFPMRTWISVLGLKGPADLHAFGMRAANLTPDVAAEIAACWGKCALELRSALGLEVRTLHNWHAQDLAVLGFDVRVLRIMRMEKITMAMFVNISLEGWAKYMGMDLAAAKQLSITHADFAPGAAFAQKNGWSLSNFISALGLDPEEDFACLAKARLAPSPPSRSQGRAGYTKNK